MDNNNTILLAKIRDVLSTLFGTFTSDLAIIKAKLEGISDLIIRNDLTTDTDTLDFNTDLTNNLCKCKVSFDLLKTGTGTPSPSNPYTISGYDTMNVAVLEAHDPDIYTVKEIEFTNTVYVGDYDLVSGSGTNYWSATAISDFSIAKESTCQHTYRIQINNRKFDTGNFNVISPFTVTNETTHSTANNIADLEPDNPWTIFTNARSAAIYIVADDTYNDVSPADFKTIFSSSKIFYELATPETISEDPETITPIEGDNRISTNSTYSMANINTTGIEVCYFETVNNYFKNKEV